MSQHQRSRVLSDFLHTLLLPLLLITSIEAAAAAFPMYPNSNINMVSVINTSTNAVVATITVGTSPFDVALTSDGTKSYVTNYYAVLFQ